MYRSQQLALKYLTAAIALFGVMTIAGLMSAYYYINSNFLFGLLDFNIAKILHIDTLIIWLLMGFMGAIYWFLPEEFGIEIAGITAAEVLFYVFCAVVAVVAAVFIFVQYGGSDALGMWLVNQGRKYVEAPRWAAIGVVIVMLVFAYNVIGTAIRAKKMTGIMPYSLSIWYRSSSFISMPLRPTATCRRISTGGGGSFTFGSREPGRC